QTLLRRKPVKPPRIPQQRPVAISSHVFDNPPHRRLNLFQPRASLLDLAHVSRGRFPRQNPHYTTTLFSGYSTIPCAFASFSRGITSQASDSSITVFTASHSGSLSV